MDEWERSPRWIGAGFAGLAVTVGVAMAAWSFSLPYLALSAGPVGDAIDSVTVDSGVDTFSPKGELLFLTVYLQEVNAYEAAAAVFDPAIRLVPRETIRPPDQTDEEFAVKGLQEMDESTETAIAVALDRLGRELVISSDGVEVVELIAGSPAMAVLQVGDVIVSIEATEVTVSQDIGDVLRSRSPGDTVSLEILRADQHQQVSVELTSAEEDPSRPLIGIRARTRNPAFPVGIDSHNVGGPSAGLMYTLAIIDVLSHGDLTAGRVVAGTGTIAADGSVGSIGGVAQKVVAAEAAGAELVLVPEANYQDAILAPVDDIEIVAVTTIDDALTYLNYLPQT